MKKIMILGASILQLPAIKKAKEMGLEVVVVDMNPAAIGFKEKNIKCEVISTIDTEKILEAARKHKIDGIMTLASDMPMRSVAKVSKEMKLIGIDEDTALRTTNKALMRECLFKNGIPVPEFFKVNSKNEFIDIIEYFKKKKMSCIIKPVDNSGSRGVDLISNFTNMDFINKSFEYSKKYSRNGDIIVEEYMEGPEVSVETLSINGICNVIQITDKLTTGAPYFVEMGHNEPSMLNEEIKKEIAKVASAAVNAVGIKNGPSHTEIKVTKNGPKIVEIGARLGGDNITTHLVPLSTGIDMVKCCIQIALGEKVDLKAKISKGSAIRYFKTELGEIEDIEGIEEAKKIKGIQQISLIYNIGEKIKSIQNSTDRAGFVIAQAATPEEAIKTCENALKKIKIKVR